jgi:predicted nucleic acid-binding protein
MRALVDLNVFLDVEQQRQPHFADSASVLSAALAGRFEAWMPAHCVTTLHYLIERHASLAAADAAVDWHLKHFRIPALDETVLKRARSLGMTDFEDAVVAASAEASNCERIVTRNDTDFTGSPVQAITPNAFLALLSVEAKP